MSITKAQWEIAAAYLFQEACRRNGHEPTESEVADAVASAMDMIYPGAVDASSDSGVLRP